MRGLPRCPASGLQGIKRNHLEDLNEEQYRVITITSAARADARAERWPEEQVT